MKPLAPPELSAFRPEYRTERTQRVGRVAAVVCAVAAVALFVVMVVAGSAVGGVVETIEGPYRLADELPWMVVNVATVLAGAALVVRLPRNPIGWCLVAIGLGFVGAGAAAFVAAAGIDGTEGTWWGYLSAWFRNWVWIVGFVGVVYLFLLFPTGSPLSPRWRTVGRVAAGVFVAVAVAAALWPEFESAPGIANPVGVAVLGPLIEPLIGVMMAVVVVALVSLIVRFLRSQGLERQQMKWVAFGCAVIVAWTPVNWIGIAPRWTVVLGPTILLVSIVVAVTRYRLYEIDRIVSRTVSYATLTLVLVGVYAAGVVGLGGLVRSVTGGGGGDLVVAASTLAVAALFGPAWRRIQAAVDRRFNRSRYDAQRTVEAFAQRLRDEVDLDALAEQLRAVTSVAIQPKAVSVWLRAEEVSP